MSKLSTTKLTSIMPIMPIIPWNEKYSPKKIDDLISNKQSVNQICTWLKSFKKNRKNSRKNKSSKVANKRNNNVPCMIVTGSHGVGKTVSVDVILKEYGYRIQTINFDEMKNSKKDYKKNITKIINSSSIVDDIITNKPMKKAIVIDELESITSTTDKNCILSLQKANDAEWYCPIIFISNNQHNKLLSEIKKSSVEIKMFKPWDSDMKKILIKIAKEEKMKMKQDVINIIINHCQSDIRQLLSTLQDIKNTYGTSITLKMINEYCKLSKRKDMDIDLFMATDKLLHDYQGIDDCLRYYEQEKVLSSLMIHQNYIKTVIANRDNNDELYDICEKVSDALSLGDVIENYIYGEQNWDMQTIHGFYTCSVTSYYLCKDIDEYIDRPQLDFTGDLNKTSIKKINKKNIGNTNKCFNDMNIMDYIYINKILRSSINDDNIKECVKNNFVGYNMKLENIESLLKIDKIKNTKTSLTSKQKKEFSKYLENI